MNLDEALHTIDLLRAENTLLKEQLAALRDELTTAQERLAELEQQQTRKKQPPDIKPSVPAREKKPRKKRAATCNRGRSYDTPTRIERHALDYCPDCGMRLHGTSIARRRQVIDLPPPQPIEVVEHQIIKRKCPRCNRWHTPHMEWAGVVIGQSRIGVRVAALIAYLRTVLRLPIRRIQDYLSTVHNLDLSVGEITRLLHEVRTALDSDIETLKKQARASPVLHADETGWRENGANGYIWAFSTPGEDAVRYYEYDRSRGQAVVKRILNGDFAGHLVSDFYGGYNVYAGKHQRCWVHLLRDLRDLRDAHPVSPEVEISPQPQPDEPLAVAVQRWCREVRGLYDDAMTWLKEHPTPTREERETQYVHLVSQSHDLGLRYARGPKHPCRALCKRLVRHEEELFQFVLEEGVVADNNLAERSIRPLVIIRKISGGSRSAAGTKTRLGLASLFGTWVARGLNALHECLRALGGTPSDPESSPAS